MTGFTVHAGSRIGSSVRTRKVLCLSVWLSSMTSWFAGREPRVPARPREAMVRCQQVGDLAGKPHVRGNEDDEVVTDPFEIGDEMRGQHDADPVLGDDLHEALEELAPGERVEARHRLVEEEELGSLRDGQRERELGPLATRQRSRLLAWVEAELIDPALGQLAVPVRVEIGAHAEVLGDR